MWSSKVDMDESPTQKVRGAVQIWYRIGTFRCGGMETVKVSLSKCDHPVTVSKSWLPVHRYFAMLPVSITVPPLPCLTAEMTFPNLCTTNAAHHSLLDLTSDWPGCAARVS